MVYNKLRIMNIEEIREYCLGKPGVTEGFPFDEHTLVFKVMGKMFALVGLEHSPSFINLKCDPEKAITLREEYEAVKPGFHMHKAQWNSVYFDGISSDDLLEEWINDSYDLVAAKLTKKLKEDLANL